MENFETYKADKSLWMMKFPPIISETWSSVASTSVDSLPRTPPISSSRREDSYTPPQFTMEMEMETTGPKSYSLNMSKDLISMGIISKSTQGCSAMEGKVEHKFDMEPH
ncbi:uncharacterized protein LOC125194692 [Salvia hispanica]|uniref:uncharacterized protein LOC125194692 n=1 Tax=Salvia hispanica TaxID=49212 RepID=UPI0020097564|nr:uncharacterized protein LOC125194692 [Salvia hispanica]